MQHKSLAAVLALVLSIQHAMPSMAVLAEEPETAQPDLDLADAAVSEEEEEAAEEGETAVLPESQPEVQSVDDDPEWYDITVWMYRQGSANPIQIESQEVQEGDTWSWTIPAKAGYVSYLAQGDLTLVEQKDTLSIQEVSKDENFYVVYVPVDTSYTVIHHFEGNKEDEKEILQGKTGAWTEAQPMETAGYTAKYFSQSSVAADGSTTVTINYAQNLYRVSFDTDGGSYIDPLEVTVDDVVELTDVPEKAGFTFLGWELNGKLVTSLSNVTAGVTLKAKWQAENVTCIVNYWQQKATDQVGIADGEKSYDYVKSTTRTVSAGDVISPTDEDKTQNWTGFVYNAVNSVDVTVSENGTTVLNVYYDRVPCTVVFNVMTTSSSNNGKPNGKPGGENTTAATTVLQSTTGLFGAPFTEWPTGYTWNATNGYSSVGAILLTSYDFYTAGYGDYVTTAADGSMTLTFTGQKSNSSTYIYYYLENYDGTFSLGSATSVTSSSASFYSKFIGYDLYKYASNTSGDLSSASFWSGQKDLSEGQSESFRSSVAVASTLQKYSISYYNYNEISKTIDDVKYTTPLDMVDGVLDAPDHPDNLPSYYVFEGWYLDPGFTQKFDPSTMTMPNANIQLYAHWVGQTFDVTVHTGLDGEAGEYSFEREGGQVGGALDTPVRDGYTFAGWYLDEDCTQPYSSKKVIESDVDVYAKWVTATTTTFSVVCTDPEGNVVYEEYDILAGIGDTIVYPAPDVEGYVPVEETKTVTVEASGTVINFDYVKNEEKFYKIQYVDEDGNVLNESSTLSNHYRSTISVRASLPEFYSLAQGYSTLQNVSMVDLSNDEDNPTVIQFVLVPTPVTVSVVGGEWTYDGAEHKATYTISGLKSKYTASVTLTAPTITHAGTQTCEAFVQIYSGGTNVTNKFDLSVVSAQLTVNPANITLTSGSATKEYDGTALTNETVDVTEGQFAGNESFTAQVTGSQTLAGTSKNAFSYTLTNGAQVSDYNISLIPGDLTVTERINKYAISLKPNTASAEYNGKIQTVSGFEQTTFEVDGQTYTVSGVTASASGKDAGTYNVTVSGTPIVKDAQGNDVSGQFNVTIETGTLEITKKKVVVSTSSASKTYDGTALTSSDAEVKGMVSGETLNVTATGTVTSITEDNVDADGNGVVSNTVEIKAGTGTALTNYDIETDLGTLTIMPKTAFISTKDASKTYDGTALTTSADDFVLAGFVSGDAPILTGTGTITHAGKTANTFTYGWNDDTALNYKVTATYGTLSVSKRDLTVTVEDGEKVYDGTALTHSKYTVSGLAANDGICVTVSGSISKITKDNVDDNGNGIAKNDAQVSVGEGTDLSDYNVTVVPGTLTLKPAKASITFNGLSKVYDGTALEAKTSDYVFSGFVEGEAPAISNGASITNAGTVTNNFTYSWSDDTGLNYVVTTKTDDLEVTKRPIVLSTQAQTKQYDGTPLTIESGAVQIEGTFPAGEGLSASVSGSQLTVGSTTPTISYTFHSGTDENNYDVTTNAGALTVTERTDKYAITLKTNTASAEYNGKTQTVSGFKQSTFEVEGQTYTVSGVSASASGKDAGTYDVQISGTPIVKDAQGNDVSSQFNVTMETGTLEITKKKVVVSTPSASKTYDGTALTSSNADVKGMVSGESLQVTTTGTITNITRTNITAEGNGVVSNTAEIEAGENTKLSNYDIETDFGMLTIMPAYVSISTKDASKTYDGTPLTTSADDVVLDGFVSGDEPTVTGTGTITHAGQTANTFTYRFNNAAGLNYKVRISYGKLTVNKRDLTVTVKDAEKEYDGTALTSSDTTIKGLVETDNLNIQTLGSISKITADNVDDNGNGIAKNEAQVSAGEGTDLADYNVTVVPGTLTLKPAKASITFNGLSKVYDGTALEAKTSDYVFSGFVEGEAPAISNGASITHAGTVTNNFTYNWNDDTGLNYVVTTKTGDLEVTKRPIVLSTAAQTKQYDGTPLTIESGAVQIEGAFPAGEGLSASVSGSQLTVGSTTPVISYTFHSGTDENNYSITTNAGALTVTERTDKYAVTLKANAASEEYNGKIQTVSGFEQTTFEVDGQTYTVSGVTATASGKDAGTYDVQISGTPIVTDALGNDVSDQFNVTFDSAQLVISPKEVILTTSDASKQYDGTELSGGQYSWSSRTLGSLKKSAGIGGAASAIVDGDEVTVTFTGSITNITADNLQEDGTGQVENTVVVSGADAGNYAVTYDLGTLTITPKAASISSAALSKEYDGTELKAEDSDYELTGFIEGDEPVITAEESAVLLHAGTTENAFTFSWEDEEFGLNYVVETDFGQMEITPKTVVLRSEDESKTYDGTALENHSVVYDFGAFVQGEEPSFVFGQEASLVSAGTADNTFELVWSEDAGFDQGDYDITVNYGTLEVVPRTVLIVTPDAVKQYDGTPLTNADVTISGDGFVEGEEPVFTAESSKTNVGTAENVVSFTWANEDDEVMLANYDITVENGTLEVLPATLYIITDSALKVEDGEELMADGEIRGVLLGEDIIFTVTGSQSGIGSSTNTYEIDWNGVDPSNYIIKEVLGQLTVVEKEETPEEEETKQPEQSTEQQPQETAEPKKQVQVDTSARTNAGLWTSLSAASLALMELLRRKNKKQ